MATKETVVEVVNMNQNYPFGMLLSGIVLIVAGSIRCSENCDGDGEALAVALGVINTILVVIYMGFLFKVMISGMADFVFVIVLFGLWVFTAGYLTFEGPFLVPGNGYVAAWLGAIFALGNLVYSSSFGKVLQARAKAQSLPLMMVIAASIVVMVAGFANSCCEDQELLAVLAGLISAIVGVIALFIGTLGRIIPIFLTVWWAVCGLILTFGEFEEIGNGYLGCWVALLASAAMLAGIGTSAATKEAVEVKN